MHKYIFLPLVIMMAMHSCKMSENKGAVADTTHAKSDTPKAVPTGQLIVPGLRIGHIRLNASADSLITELRKPRFSDAAMGAQLLIWNAWYKKVKYETATYSHRNMGMADDAVSYIKLIRTSSPRFKTADFLGAGSNLNDLMKRFKLKKYPLPAAGPKGTWLYDDTTAGIGFEADTTGKCVAVLVHEKKASLALHTNMHP
jgi:hypothetical protein